MALGWRTALAWRAHRHFSQNADLTAAQVVDSALAVPAHPFDAADLGVRLRGQSEQHHSLHDAVAAGEVIRSYAFRGGTYLLTPNRAAPLLALRAHSGLWKRSSWRQHYGLDDAGWEAFRAAVRDALRDGPATRAEMRAAVSRHEHLRALPDDVFAGSDVLLKPLHWLGDISFGPTRDGETTFQLLSGANPRWPEPIEIDDAGERSVVDYVAAYGPATEANLEHWLSDGLGVRKQLIGQWIAHAGTTLATVDIDGEHAYVLAADRDDLTRFRPSDSVHFLIGRDTWVMGPGTADPHLVPAARRAIVTRGANLVLHNGMVSGTWQFTPAGVAVTWFDEAGPAPDDLIEGEARRLDRLTGRAAACSMVIDVL